METIPLTVAPQKIKYLGVNLTKDVNEHPLFIHKENYKPLKKEIEEDVDCFDSDKGSVHLSGCT
jgi:hypothetical protein